MTIFVINPGSGPVAESSLEYAAENIKVYAEDIAKYHGLKVLEIYRLEEDDDRGRYAYALDLEKEGMARRIRVDMPGLPLDKVRYLDLPKQEISSFPRLYIDDSSWLWKFAIHVARVERDEDQSSAITRCPEQIQIYDVSHRCERDSVHKGMCQATVVVAGYTEKELGPNIWTFVKWVAARNIPT
jgi:hypothetical protein